MLSAEDHPGIFYFLVGMIVLVMAGVGLSLLADQRFKFSSGTSDIKRDIATTGDELGSLRSYHQERSRQLENNSTRLKSDTSVHAELRRKSTDLGKRHSDLEINRDQLLKAIPLIETEFSRYRAEYRRQTWAGAVGQKVGTISIRGGREYQDVIITRVTDVGLEIRHKDGIARIQAPDLDPKWQDRFQWSDEERRNRLKEELANHDSIAPPPPAATEEPLLPLTRFPRSADEPDDAKLQDLRTKVIAWNSKISRLQMEKSEAASQSYGGGNSVTGSLETWKAKSARVSAELAKASTELVIAKSHLAAVSPNDALLRTPEHGTGTSY